MDRPVALRTDDGSMTLYLPGLDETYHSRKGAERESRHVFLKEGLERFLSENEGADSVSVFELGFGTGLNAALTVEFALENGLRVHYESLEAFPLAPGQVAEMGYETLLSDEARPCFDRLHAAPWGAEAEVFEGFSLLKRETSLLDWEPTERFEVVYYDAFAPEKQPELWEEEPLAKCYAALRPGGVLVTYCAQGQFKRNLKAVGFSVERLPGPPGKREMTRATKPLA